jgi:hypothetical protein
MKKKHLILMFIWLFFSQLSFGQIQIGNAQLSKKFAVGLSVGTMPGLEVAYHINNHLNVRADYHFLKYQVNTSAESSNESVYVSGKLKMSAIALSLEYLPFQKSSFKLIGGFTYLDQASFFVEVSPESTYTFGSTVFTPEEIGLVSFGLDYGKSIVPFVGIGFGRAVPQKRIGVGFEVGSYYLNSPIATLVGKERLSSMSNQAGLVQANTNDWRYWPMMNLKFSFKLSK